MKNFLNDGFVILKDVIPASLAMNLRQNIQDQLVINAQELAIEINQYLYCTGRWSSPSPVVSCIDEEIGFTIQHKLENMLNQKIEMEKSNVICKNSSIRDAVALHQDISYSPNSPYHFSLWLALNDINEQSGPLQFILGSHKWPISPAVDFWSPEIKFNSILEQVRQNQMQIITLKKGDAVMFDSRLWHGSIKSTSGHDRYAYVSRWKIIAQMFPEIPKLQPSFFGMWNCHQITKDILFEQLHLIKSEFATNDNLVELISHWQILIQNNNISESIDQFKVVQDLENVKILHIAANTHHAGDLTGKIYKNLWNSLLRHLQNKSSPS